MSLYKESCFELQPLPNDYDVLAQPIRITEICGNIVKDHGVVDRCDLDNLKCAIEDYLSGKTFNEMFDKMKVGVSK